MARFAPLAPAFAVFLGAALIGTGVAADTRGAGGDSRSHVEQPRDERDPQPEVATPANSSNSPVEIGIDGFNPQPEPPPQARITP